MELFLGLYFVIVTLLFCHRWHCYVTFLLLWLYSSNTVTLMWRNHYHRSNVPCCSWDRGEKAKLNFRKIWAIPSIHFGQSWPTRAENCRMLFQYLNHQRLLQQYIFQSPGSNTVRQMAAVICDIILNYWINIFGHFGASIFWSVQKLFFSKQQKLRFFHIYFYCPK